MLCSSPPTVTADDDRTRRLPLLLISGRLEDALEQLAAVGDSRTGRQLDDGIDELLCVGRVVDEPLRLSHDAAQGHLRAALEQLHEVDEARAEDARAVVVDDDGDLHRDARQFHLEDVPVLAILLDGEVVGNEVDDRRAVPFGRGDENCVGAF